MKKILIALLTVTSFASVAGQGHWTINSNGIANITAADGKTYAMRWKDTNIILSYKANCINGTEAVYSVNGTRLKFMVKKGGEGWCDLFPISDVAKKYWIDAWDSGKMVNMGGAILFSNDGYFETMDELNNQEDVL